MAVTVFDAVGKFFADTSNLDEFIVKLEHGLTGASEKAAVSTQALKAAQVEFRDAIKAVNVEGGNTVANMERLAQAEKNLALATAAARQEHAALKAELIETKEATGVAAQATEELTGKLTSMFGLIAAFEGFRRLIEGTQQSVLNLELLSQKTGIAIDTLAGIEHVSEAAGVKIEEVSTALTRLARAQALAIEGGKQQIAAFERIGISATELKNLSPEQLFYRVADAMSNSSSHAAAAASAFALLGRGGAALIPIFQQNTEALRAQIEEAAKNSAVTKEAGDSAREWEKQVANITEAFRAGMIPIMQVTVPVIKGVETGVSALSLVIRDLAAIVGGAAIGIFNSFKGLGTLIADTISGDWKKLAVDAKAVAFEVTHDFGGIGVQFKDNWRHTTEAIKETWTQVNPLKQAKDDLSELGNTKGDAALQKFLEARILAEKQAADAEVDLQLQKNRAMLGSAQLTFTEELKLQGQANAAKYDNAKKALNDQLELALSEGEKGRAQAARIVSELNNLETERQAKLLKTWTDLQKELQHVMSQPIPLVNTLPPGMDVIQNEITKGFDQETAAARTLGITLQTQLHAGLSAAFDAYDKLVQLQKVGIATQKDVDNGYKALIKSELAYAIATGASEEAVKKLQQQLKDIIQAELVDAKAKGASVEVIKKLEKELRGATAAQKGFFASLKSAGGLELAWERDLASGSKAMRDFGATAQFVSDEFGSAWESAFQQWILGEKSLGQALAAGTAQVMAQLAARALVYGLFYTAQGIADVFWMPARSAADFAAAAEFFAIGGAFAGGAAAVNLGAGGGGGSSASSGGGGSPGPAANSPNLNSQEPSQTVNVTHMTDTLQSVARMSPTLSIPSSLIYPQTGSSSSAGSVSGMISKQDIQELTKAIKQNPGMSHVNVTIEGDLPMLLTKINHGTKTGRLRLHSTSTSKTIKQA